MMINWNLFFEIIIVLCLGVVFVIFARRLPSGGVISPRKKFTLFRPRPSTQAKDGLSFAQMTLQPKAEADFFQLAENDFEKKDYEGAEKNYLLAIQKHPSNAKIYNRLGVIYLEKKRYLKAVEVFRKAISIDDKVASRYFNLAVAYFHLKDQKRALDAIQKALAIDKGNQKYQQMLEGLLNEPSKK
jgi:tetratricopeptide (TPR) repeat protein